MTARAAVVAIVLLAPYASAAAGEPPCVDAGLVMVRATYDDGHVERGAGNVIKIDDAHTYVVTARHVVAKRGTASRIEVGFRAESPVTHAAGILTQSDSDDWAVLDVGMPATLRASRLCALREADELKQGDRIHYVGHPTDPLVSWAVGDGEVTGFGVNRILFAATVGAIDVGEGFSGGALYDEKWRLVGMIVNTQRNSEELEHATALPARGNERNGIALSARGIINAVATGENPLATDLYLEEPPRATLVALGAAGSYGRDPYISNRWLPMTAAVLTEIVGWRVGAGRLLVMAGAEGSLEILARTTTLTDFPGAAPMTGSTLREYIYGVGVTTRVQLQCRYAAAFIDAGVAYDHLSESDRSDDTAQLVLGAGVSIGIPLGVPLSFFARARWSVPSTFDVPDYRFTLSGQPGLIERPIDNPSLVVFGLEYRVR